MSGSIDQRKHERITFFLIPVEREQLPVWVFLPEASSGVAGVILDMSLGGVRVLVRAQDALPEQRYTLRLIVDASDTRLPRFSGIVRRVWSDRLTALGTLHGMEFENPGSDVAEFLRAAPPSTESRRWVRCALEPCEPAGN